MSVAFAPQLRQSLTLPGNHETATHPTADIDNTTMRMKLLSRLLYLPRRWKRAILITFDVFALGFMLWCILALRYDRWIPPGTLDEWAVVLSAPLVAVPIFHYMGLYRSVVRYLPERMLLTALQAMTVAALAWVMVAFLSELTGRGFVPRSVPIIYWALGSITIVGSRFLAKWLLWSRGQVSSQQRPAVAIYGAGETGTQLVHSLRNSHYIAGFLDDDTSLHRRDVAGVKVFPPSQLPVLIRDFGVKQVILSMPSVSAIRRREIVTKLSRKGLTIQSLPGMTDLVSGRYLVSQIREIEIDDLLGRSSVPPDSSLIRDMIFGRTIMVTGAGGSIGSELCRQIAGWQPRRMVLFEANEYSLYQIDRDLGAYEDIVLVPILGSVIDRQKVELAVAEHDVEVIFHAAAHKHVPLVEANALEGIRNNVFGTLTVAEVALDQGVRDFVLISSDKAVRPTNVMGATKRWAELVVRSYAASAQEHGTGQRFCAVRFGNVLGSNGSVVPLFKSQITKGGPITLTDRAMTRYFMSIREAAELIVQAGSLSESGDVFLLDMGDPMLISDLAANMVRLAGLTIKDQQHPEGDIEIIVTGKRPGEKLYEELFYDSTSAATTRHPKIMRAAARPIAPEMLREGLRELEASLAAADEQRARRVLFGMIREREANFASEPAG